MEKRFPTLFESNYLGLVMITGLSPLDILYVIKLYNISR